jgi:hypothetical protein
VPLVSNESLLFVSLGPRILAALDFIFTICATELLDQYMWLFVGFNYFGVANAAGHITLASCAFA